VRKPFICAAIGRAARLLKVNCAAIPAGLLVSELFGHERGAYTGAVSRGIGRFERADLGTLFLDEIGDLPLELQPKLLRVMQQRQFERLGRGATIRTDLRVLCATHQNLFDMVEKREFRDDLFYGLSAFPMERSPLRDRSEDTRLLVHHFATHYAAQMGKRITVVSEEFMAVLVERICATQDHSPLSKPSAPVTLEEAERSHILQTQQTEGAVGGRYGAAARLGVPRTTLIAKMKRLGIINRGQSSVLPVRSAAPVPNLRRNHWVSSSRHKFPGKQIPGNPDFSPK
jgi:transcriptional regulator with GAF, ATPase, and Fis domain